MAGRGAHRARRAPGRAADRHFVRTPALAAALVAHAAVEPGDLVLDVGAGSGRLTKALVDAGAEVLAIELDPVLARGLRVRFADTPSVTIVEGDALATPLPARPFRVVANLPFGRTTEILRRLLGDPRVQLVHADVIVEWAVAQKRAAVWPSTRLGVCWSAWYELVVTRRLPAGCFEPRPSVDAALLRAARRARPLVPESERRPFAAFVGTAFADGGLGRLVPPKTLKRVGRSLGFDRTAAPRDLDAHQWAALFAAVRGRS